MNGIAETGAGRLASALAKRGPSTIFGLLGDGNLLWVDHAVRVHGLRFIATRHEHAAVAAAAGWAHSTDGIGVATTTHGPGFAQTTSALITAVKARLPVLLVVGATHPMARLHAQRCDQRALALACGASYVAVRGPSSVEDDLSVAFRGLADGPVVLDIDLGLLDAPAPPSRGLHRMAVSASGAPPRPAPSQEEMAQVVRLLAEADRPLILLGRGAAAAAESARELAEAVDAIIGTTLLGQGLLDNHPRQVGVVGGFSTPEAREALADVDVVLALGASMTRYTVDKGALLTDATIIQVDVDPRAIGDPVAVEIGIVADADATASAAMHLLRQHPVDLPKGRSGAAVVRGRPLGDTTARVRDDPDGDDPRDVIEAVDLAVPQDRAVVVGVGHYSGWASLGIGTPTPDARFLPWDFGAVGVALGAAIGMAAARPDRPTICIEGDGGILMTLPELDTLARESLQVLVVVLDDRGFGAEADILRRAGQPTDRAWIPTPDLVSTARGLGLAAETARGDRVGEMAASLCDRLPALLHVPTSREAVHHEIFAALGP